MVKSQAFPTTGAVQDAAVHSISDFPDFRSVDIFHVLTGMAINSNSNGIIAPLRLYIYIHIYVYIYTLYGFITDPY